MVWLREQRLLCRWCRALVGCVLLLGLSACFDAATTSDETTLSSLTYAAVPGDDAPELAHLGPYAIGVKTLEFAYEGAPDITVASHVMDTRPTWTRVVSVDVLYPADIADADAPRVIYQGNYHTGFTAIEGLPDGFEIQGLAVRDAPVSQTERFPLVVVSHGLLNTPGVLSGITENLASKGYVVAAIDHRDAQDDPATPVHLFARVLLNRVLDQRRVLSELMSLAEDQTNPLGRIIDVDKIGLIGFSMGGYGVLGHVGAGFDPDGGAFSTVPTELLSDQLEGDAGYEQRDRSHIDAVVAFAPWGGKQGDVWTESALSGIRAPLLVLAGSQDDVSDFENGIRRVYDAAVNADRHMLVFQNAQHNLVQVPAPKSAHLDVRSWMTFEDATWRRERLLSVGAHFVTAFLDWRLKGIEGRKDYLSVPTVRSNDAVWEQSAFSDNSDQYADGEGDSAAYWKGFKPRQAIGLELYSAGPD